MNSPKSTKQDTFHTLVERIIDRLYPRDSQETARIILKAWFRQSPLRRRELTLEELGKTPALKEPKTKEWARQIKSKFLSRDLPAEIERAKINHDSDGLANQARQMDILQLRGLVERIIEEVETFSFPIFAYRMQARLKRLGLVDDYVYFTVITDMAESFNIPLSFNIEEYDDRRLLTPKKALVSELTMEIVKYAARRATKLGGVYPISNLANSDIDSKKPPGISKIDIAIREKYLTDLFKNEGLIPLQNFEFFAFRERDERISTILKPIFRVYKGPLPVQRVFDSVQIALKEVFMRGRDTPLRTEELHILEQSNLALQEYAINEHWLDRYSDSQVKAGSRLKNALRNYELPERYAAQARLLKVIRKRGGPVSSMEFGRIFREELSLKSALKTICYSYPSLYYKAGGGRMRDYYRTLDDNYDSVTSATRRSTPKRRKKVKFDSSKLIELERAISSQDNNKVPMGQMRLEQRYLRNYLLEKSDGYEMANGETSCRCALCARYFPGDLLVAAHVKKRSACSMDEICDFKNVAMLQCATCDRLFERGYVYIDENGETQINDGAPLTDDLNDILIRLRTTRAPYALKLNSKRQAYLKHRRGSAPQWDLSPTPDTSLE